MEAALSRAAPGPMKPDGTVRERIAVVDDEAIVCAAVKRILESAGYRVATSTSPAEALESIRHDPPDMVICDLKMPQLDGMTVLERIKAHDPGVAVVMMSGYSSIESAVEAVKKGAEEYLPKPFSPAQLRLVVERAFERRRLLEENTALRETVREASGRNAMIGRSAAIGQLLALVDKVAATDSSVLITGESGSGKEVVARAIHFLGTRAKAPFVTVNCSAIPRDLLESELFGHRKGAFTGALYTRRGSFEQADGGTFFLDEIGDMQLEMQAKILRVLEEKKVRKVGSEDETAVDVRIVAATNRDLKAEIAAGRFREDLYYRLNIVHIRVPPLRERKSDVPLLARHFLKLYSADMRKPPGDFSEEALALMTGYDWPGNVRELRNAVERAVIFASDGEPIRTHHFPPELRDRLTTAPARCTPLKSLRTVEIDYIREVLRACDGNKARAAEILGIAASTIWRKLHDESS
jgi:DNA-binding NtrC family response regulator